jgi:hypothetical protein
MTAVEELVKLYGETRTAADALQAKAAKLLQLAGRLPRAAVA